MEEVMNIMFKSYNFFLLFLSWYDYSYAIRKL